MYILFIERMRAQNNAPPSNTKLDVSNNFKKIFNFLICT